MLTQFIFKEPTTTGAYGTWVAPDKRSPVTSVNFDGGPELITLLTTEGTTRAPKSRVSGLMQASGSLTMPAYPTGFLPWAIRSFLADNDSTASGSGFINDLLPDDSLVQFPWFSLQLVYSESEARSVRGAVPSSWTLSAAAGAEMTTSFDFVAQDIAHVGGNWHDKPPTAAPAVVAVSTIADPLPRPFVFCDGRVLTGTNVTKSGNKLTLVGGTKIANLESFTLELDLAVEGKSAIDNTGCTINRTRHNLRKATLTGDLDWADPNATYWETMNAGTQLFIQIELVSSDEYDIVLGLPYKMIITLPHMVMPSAGDGTPALMGDKVSKNQSLTFESFEDSDTVTDIGVTIHCDEDLT
jgi:hypothetical protein